MSSHQQQSPAPQPRGLPGFLRRTFRNSYEESVDEISSSRAAETDASGSGNTSNAPLNDSLSKLSVAETTSTTTTTSTATANNNNDNDNGIDAAAKEMLSTPGAAARSGSNGSVGSSTKKQLRKVAFPPLPFVSGKEDETEGEESSDETNTTNNATATNTTRNKQKSQAASSSTPPASFNSSSHPPQQQQPPNSPTPQNQNTSNNTTSTSTNNNNNNPPIKKTYKQLQFESIITSPIISLRDLRKLAWNGIPPHHRPLSWKILLGYLPANASRHKTTLDRKRSEYKDAISQHYDIPDDSRTNSEQETLRQVLVDVPRTAPEVKLFHNDRIRRCLSRLLYIWAMRHPASSYVQGINDLATPLIAVFLSDYFEKELQENNGECCTLNGECMVNVTDTMLEEVEADTYWCLTNLLAGIQDHYTSDQPGMQRMVMRLEELVNRIDADLATHLRNTGIEFIQFAFKWMNCLLLREFRLECVLRLWDTYLSEGDGGFEDFHVYVCASFLVHFSNELQQMDFDELFQFMQNMPTDDWGDREIEILLSSAYVLSTLFGGSEAHLNVVRR